MTFRLRMMRPDKEFFSGEVESLEISVPEGRETILAGHMPMFLNLTTDLCSFRLADGTVKTFAVGEGMLSIFRDETVLQSDFLAWEDRMSAAIARRKSFMEAEKERRKSSFLEYKLNKTEMAKTFIKLQNKHPKEVD